MQKSNLTYENVLAITKANESFKMKHQMVGDTEVAMCTYFLASPGAFFDAKNDGSMINAQELRGITFIREPNKDWTTHLFISKWFNVNQTSGTDITSMVLQINDEDKQICNINRLFGTKNAEKVCRALDLKVGMVVGDYNRKDETVTSLREIIKIEKTVLPPERPENSWMYHDVKDLEITRIANKDDGSAIRFLIINDVLVAKTKFSLESEQCEMAMEVVNADASLKAFIYKTLEMGLVALFEIVSPHNKIVLSYNYTALKLLQLRVEATGEYLDIYTQDIVNQYNIITADSEDLEKIERVANTWSKKAAIVAIGDNKFTSIDGMCEYLIHQSIAEVEPQKRMSILDFLLLSTEYIDDKEGVVITFSNGKIAKIKNVAYLFLHGILSDGLKEHKIISRIVDNTIDDVIATIPPENTVEREFIDGITVVITQHINHIASAAEKKFKKLWTGDKKTLAIESKKEDKHLFPYIMVFAKGASYEEVETIVSERVQFECRRLEMAKKYLRELGFTTELKLLEDDE